MDTAFLYKKILPEVKRIATEAGRFQMQHFRSMPEEQQESKALRELVSFVDIESEKLIIKQLKKLIPNAGFHGEESGKSGNQEFVWVIDPLDGTTNFLCGLEQFSISIALVDNSTPLLGVVTRPTSGDIYYAVKDHGYYRNGIAIEARTPQSMEKCLIGTGMPFRSPDCRKAYWKCADEVLDNSLGIRRFGSAALDLAYLAAGYFQGFWETDLQPYDVAAGLVFLNESNCQYSRFSGKDYDLFSHRTFVAGIPDCYDTLQAITHRHYQKLEIQ